MFIHPQTDVQGSGRPMLTTPNRFTRTSPNAYWNPGNGSPDAICFTVDRAGIVIAGVCVYGGGGQYDYDVELLDDVSIFYDRGITFDGWEFPSFVSKH